MYNNSVQLKTQDFASISIFLCVLLSLVHSYSVDMTITIWGPRLLQQSNTITQLPPWRSSDLKTGSPDALWNKTSYEASLCCCVEGGETKQSLCAQCSLKYGGLNSIGRSVCWSHSGGGTLCVGCLSVSAMFSPLCWWVEEGTMHFNIRPWHTRPSPENSPTVASPCSPASWPCVALEHTAKTSAEHVRTAHVWVAITLLTSRRR